MSREKVSISLDKDEKSLRTFKIQHMVKAMPLTLWHLTNFFQLILALTFAKLKLQSSTFSLVNNNFTAMVCTPTMNSLQHIVTAHREIFARENFRECAR